MATAATTARLALAAERALASRGVFAASGFAAYGRTLSTAVRKFSTAAVTFLCGFQRMARADASSVASFAAAARFAAMAACS